MTFLLVFIFVGIGIIILIFEKFKWFIIIAILLFIIYLILRYRKEKSTFKSVNTSFIELCLPIIKEINGYKKIILNDNHIILISAYGIFVICVLNKTGVINENTKSNILVSSYGKSKSYLPNIFAEQDEIISKYQKMIAKKIEKYIITSNDCDIIGFKDNISKYRLFINDFKRKYKNKILNKKEIDDIYKIVKR